MAGKRHLDTAGFRQICPENYPVGKPFVVIDISEMWAGSPPKACALAKALHTSQEIVTFIKCKDTCVMEKYSEAGDYEIHIPLQDGTYRVLGIERKTFSDYYGRIATAKTDRKHMDHQLLRLIDRFGPENSFILLEAFKSKPPHVSMPVYAYKQAVWTGVNHRIINVPHFFSENTKQTVDLFKWLMKNKGRPVISDDLFESYKDGAGCPVFEVRED